MQQRAGQITARRDWRLPKESTCRKVQGDEGPK